MNDFVVQNKLSDVECDDRIDFGLMEQGVLVGTSKNSKKQQKTFTSSLHASPYYADKTRENYVNAIRLVDLDFQMVIRK